MGHIENHGSGGVMIRNNVNAPKEKRVFMMSLIGNVMSPRKAEKIIRLKREELAVDCYFTIASLAPKQHAAFDTRAENRPAFGGLIMVCIDNHCV